MAESSLNTLLPLFAKRIGAFTGAFTTSANPTGSAKTLTSTGFGNAGYNDDGDLEDHWFRITSGTDDDLIRRCDSFTGASGTGVATLAAGDDISSGSSVTFEVYTRNPQEIIDFLNAARYGAFPDLHRVIVDRDTTAQAGKSRYAIPSNILTPQRLYEEPRLPSGGSDSIIATLDDDFEGNLTDFTASSATLTAEADTTSPSNPMVLQGAQSGKIVVAAGATGYVYLTVPDPTNYVGEELNLSLWLHALTVASVTTKASIRTDAGSWSVGTEHGGDGYERLSVSLSDQSIANSIHVGVQIVNGSSDAYVVYTDEWLATAGRTENPYLTGEPITNWYREGDIMVVPNGVGQGNQLLVRGIGTISALTTGASTTEVGEDRYELLWQSAIAAMTEAEFNELDSAELNGVQRLNTHARNRRTDNAMVLPSTRRSPV